MDNGWGERLVDKECPVAMGSLLYKFNMDDVATLKKNKDAIASVIEEGRKTAKLKEYEAKHEEQEKKNAIKALPDWWFKTSKPTDAKLSASSLAPMIKIFIGQSGLNYIKHTIGAYTGSLWQIAKDEYGLPRYRYATPPINILTKQKTHPVILRISGKLCWSRYHQGLNLKGLYEPKYIERNAMK